MIALPSTLGDYIEASEGRRLFTYDDKTGARVEAGGAVLGTLTGGVGHTGPDVVAGMVISDALAEAWKERDISIAAHGAALDIGGTAWARLDLCRRVAVVDMCFELGQRRLDGFHDMIAAVRVYDWPRAVAALRDSKYEWEVRRRAERNAFMLAAGAWPPAALW